MEPLQLNLAKARNGRLLADSFTVMAADDQDWHGQLVQVSLNGVYIGTARVQVTVPFLAEKLTDKSCMITLGLPAVEARSLYMREFGGIHPNTRMTYIVLTWISRDLAPVGTMLFNDQWAKLVEAKETQIQTA